MGFIVDNTMINQPINARPYIPYIPFHIQPNTVEYKVHVYMEKMKAARNAFKTGLTGKILPRNNDALNRYFSILGVSIAKYYNLNITMNDMIPQHIYNIFGKIYFNKVSTYKKYGSKYIRALL